VNLVLKKIPDSFVWNQPQGYLSLASKTGVSSTSHLRHEFFANVKDFILSKVDHFLKGKSSSYSVQTDASQGLILIKFSNKHSLPSLVDIKSMIDHLNATAYLFDTRNSINAFSVKEQTKGEFVISYDGSIFGHDPEHMRKLAEELAFINREVGRK
jgi:hypothetical protein